MGAIRKQFGKIASIRLGSGGYDDAMFGVTVIMSFDGTGCQDFKGSWQTYSHGAQYSKEQWEDSHHETYDWLRELMRQAKVDDFTKLAGAPIEAEFNGLKLSSWRILSEVL